MNKTILISCLDNFVNSVVPELIVFAVVCDNAHML